MSMLWMSFKLFGTALTHTHMCRHTLGADLLLQNELHQNSDLTASPASCPPPPLSLPHSFLVFNPQLSGSLTFLNHHNHTTIYYRCGDANASGTLLPLMVCCFNDIKVNGAWYIANATLTYSPKKTVSAHEDVSECNAVVKCKKMLWSYFYTI